MFLALSFLTLIANAEMTITNGTGCLVSGPNNTVSFAKPVTIYTFVGAPDTSGTYVRKYSGVSVAPGQAHVSIPTSIAQGVTPATIDALLGADQHDAPAHIVDFMPAVGDYLVVQMVIDVPGTGCSNPNYPCVDIASGQTASQCMTLLSQSKPTLSLMSRPTK